MAIDVEAVYIDIESFYLFKMGVCKEGAPASYGARRSSLRGLLATEHEVIYTWRQLSHAFFWVISRRLSLNANV
jgi:hypothetical protein